MSKPPAAIYKADTWHVDDGVATDGSDRLAVVAQLEHQVAVLSRKLGFDHPSGGGDGR